MRGIFGFTVLPVNVVATQIFLKDIMTDYPFTTDGCSGGMSWLWKKVFKEDPPWERRCIEHDEKYWLGGSRRDRALADGELAVHVSAMGYPTLSILMWIAVRIGGHPLLPFPWRWGYGWKYPRGYQE